MLNSIVRIGATLLLVTTLLAAVGGCGKKGALYLPPKGDAPTTPK